MTESLVRWLVREHGTTFAEQSGVELTDEPGPLWQLLVVALLSSTRIRADVATATARELWAAGWATPEALRRSTWSERVAALGRGGYRRYDFSTATRLDAAAVLLENRWGSDLRRLRDEAGGGPSAISTALQTFDGIGPVGAQIFLREVQAVWPQVRPATDRLVGTGAALVGLPSDPAELAALVAPEEMVRLAAALVRVARQPSLAADAPDQA